VNQVRELIVCDGFLIFLEHVPARARAEDTNIVRSSKSRCEYRKGDRKK